MTPFKRWLLLISALTAIAYFAPFESALEPIYAPTLGETPDLFLTVRGEKHPDLDLEFTAKYVTTNPSCQKLINWLEGIYSDRTFSVSGTVEQNQTSFLAKIPVILIEDSGHCGWRFYKTYVTVKHKDPAVNPQTQELVSIKRATGKVPPLPSFSFLCEILSPQYQGGGSSVFCAARERRYYSVNDNAPILDIGFRMRQ